jgi:hypothetical protein
VAAHKNAMWRMCRRLATTDWLQLILTRGLDAVVIVVVLPTPAVAELLARSSTGLWLLQDYWLTEYLTISNILKNAPAQYARSYLYTETDDRDVTYFILYQLRIIMRAIKVLDRYLRRKMTEIRETEKLFKRSRDLNRRQIDLLSYALRNPDVEYTVKGHATTHNIGLETARLDLADLEERDLLIRQKIGKAYTFAPPFDLSERLRSLSGTEQCAMNLPRWFGTCQPPVTVG